MTSIVGSIVRFFCISNKEKKWTFNDQQLPQNVAIKGRFQEYIILTNLQLSNDGIYKCITKDDYDMKYVAEGRLVVVDKDHYHAKYDSKDPLMGDSEFLINSLNNSIRRIYIYYVAIVEICFISSFLTFQLCVSSTANKVNAYPLYCLTVFLVF